MAIDFGNDGGGSSLPWVRHMIEENVWIVNDPEGLDDVRLKSNAGELTNPIFIDIAKIQLGWLKISGGRDFIPWPGNDPKAISRPTETQMSFGEEKPAYGRAFQVMVYSEKNFVSDDGRQLAPLRIWSSMSAGHKIFMEKLYEAAEASPNFGSKVPVVSVKKAVFTKEYGGPTKVHEFEILDWMDAPDSLAQAEFPNSGNAASATQPVTQAQPQANDPSPAADSVASGDFSGGMSSQVI